MNKIAILFIVLLITGVFLSCNQKINNRNITQDSVSTAQHSEILNLFIENESNFSFDESAEMIKAEVEKKTWKVTAIHDLQETLKKNGQDVLPIKVFAICHPKYSGQILAGDDERIVSPLMPCRVSLYQKTNGKTYVSRMNPEVITKLFSGKTAELMKESSLEVEEILKAIYP